MVCSHGKLEHRSRRRGNDLAATGAVLDDLHLPLPIDVVHVEAAVRRVARVKGHRKETLQKALLDEWSDVEEGTPEHTAANRHADRPALFDDVQPSRLARSYGDV